VLLLQRLLLLHAIVVCLRGKLLVFESKVPEGHNLPIS
jgi:hypothetical protein